jgi:hypothetical protein
MALSVERPRRAARAPYLAALAGLAALAADVVFDPRRRHVPLCPFHAATGWDCPLCGGLRSADALAHLQVGAALRDNLLLVAALPVLALWWSDWVARGRAGRPPRALGRGGAALLVVLAVGFTVVRNLPVGRALRP